VDTPVGRARLTGRWLCAQYDNEKLLEEFESSGPAPPPSY